MYNNKFLIYSNFLFSFDKFFLKKSLTKNFILVIDKYFLFKNNFIISFCKNNLFLNLLTILYFKLKKLYLFLYCGFLYSKIFLKVGLGFRKKYSLTTNIYSMFIGRRKWITFKLEPSSFFFNIRRRNIFMFCNTKKKLYSNLVRLKHVRKETVYKVKGIMSLNRIIFNRKISRSIIFARRVKFRKMKLKLTKKQKHKK